MTPMGKKMAGKGCCLCGRVPIPIARNRSSKGDLLCNPCADFIEGEIADDRLKQSNHKEG